VGVRSQLFNVAVPIGASEIHRIGHPEHSYELDERTRDGNMDLIMHFKPSESGLTFDSTQACLKGKYLALDGRQHLYVPRL
jgi:hypothetical protein